jgi:5'(3')-deoxyribonucleotidase
MEIHDRMRKRVLVDMDGVLSDVYQRLYDMHEHETGVRLKPADVEGKLEEEAFPFQRKWVFTPGFFRDLPVMEGSREGMLRLMEKYEVIVASLATEFPASLTDKMLWLHDYFPFISWKQVVFCGDKSLVEADIMIDDHPKNLDRFDGKTYMFTQPNNILLNDMKHERLSDWNDLVTKLM